MPSSFDANGVPVYDSNGRASTSAKITNPFIEFAIKNGGKHPHVKSLAFV